MSDLGTFDLDGSYHPHSSLLFEPNATLNIDSALDQYLSKYIKKLKIGETMSDIPVNIESPNSLSFTIYPYKQVPGEPLAPYNVYITHDESVPHDTIIIDYFSSGQLFCNLKKISISSANQSIQVLYKNYLFNSSTDLSSPPPKVGYQSRSLNIATAVASPTSNEVLAWMFPLATFFTSQSKPQEIPVCIYYTYHSPASDSTPVKLTSKHYPYANYVESTPHCSHPDIPSSSSFLSCSFSANQSLCSKYTPNTTILHQSVVTPANTESTISFSIVYSLSSFGGHLFQIKNDTNDTILNTFNYPLDINYDQCLNDVRKYYDQYLDVYQTDLYLMTTPDLSPSDDTSRDTNKSSYITSLIPG